MGRTIRRVPEGWEHPRDERGHYIPMYDVGYDTAANEWLEGLMKWEQNEEWKDETQRYYWEWDGGPPDVDTYRAEFEEEPTHYQIYETVSEGTPMSPVFETLEDMVEWLVGEGYSRRAAQAFAESGWAMSMMIVPGVGIWKDIETCGLPTREDD